jgi:hypothetical protein
VGEVSASRVFTYSLLRPRDCVLENSQQFRRSFLTPLRRRLDLSFSETREMFCRHAIARIRNHDANVPVARCKETPPMRQVFDGLVDATKCNYLP